MTFLPGSAIIRSECAKEVTEYEKITAVYSDSRVAAPGAGGRRIYSGAGGGVLLRNIRLYRCEGGQFRQQKIGRVRPDREGTGRRRGFVRPADPV